MALNIRSIHYQMIQELRGEGGSRMLKFSTIGTNWITELFIAAANKTGKARLISIYSRSEDKAPSFADKHGAEKWFTSLDDMLKDESDFVYVASPNVLHYEHIMKCMENGKHVFCEKPMIYTKKQWDHIHKKAKEQNVFVFEGYRHLYSPNYQTLKNRLQQVGQIRSVFFHYIQYSSRYDAFKEGESPNVFSKAFAGGVLMDLGVYPLSMAIDLFGEPANVNYFPVLLENGIDGSGTLVLTYDDFIVTIICSKIAQATIPSEIHGEEGTMTLDHISPITSLSFYDRTSETKKELGEPLSDLDMVYEINEFIHMVEQKDDATYEKWMQRSLHVVKWAEKARRAEGIRFPGEA